MNSKFLKFVGFTFKGNGHKKNQSPTIPTTGSIGNSSLPLFLLSLLSESLSLYLSLSLSLSRRSLYLSLLLLLRLSRLLDLLSRLRDLLLLYDLSLYFFFLSFLSLDLSLFLSLERLLLLDLFFLK